MGNNITQQRMHHRRSIISVILIIIAIIVLCPYIWFYNKPIHLSIDDVEICMRDLQFQDSLYSSIFKHPFFSRLKSLHDNAGIKITLYTYEKSGEYSIAKIPQRFIQEFVDNKDWLLFGYHAKEPNFVKDSVASIEYFKKSFNVLKNSNITYLGGG